MKYRQGQQNRDLVVTITDSDGNVLARHALDREIHDTAYQFAQDGEPLSTEVAFAFGRDEWVGAVTSDMRRFANGQIELA